MSTAELGLHTPQSQAIAMMCRCDGLADEGVELQVLKGLLTATTSSTFSVHGQVRQASAPLSSHLCVLRSVSTHPLGPIHS